jgi:hypothetical protein
MGLENLHFQRSFQKALTEQQFQGLHFENYCPKSFPEQCENKLAKYMGNLISKLVGDLHCFHLIA